MIFSISGKAQSGKDTVGEIFQYLIYKHENKNTPGFYYPSDEWLRERNEGLLNVPIQTKSNWEIKKFAYKVKQITSLLTGIPVEDLENEEVKNRVLGEEWIRYGEKETIMNHKSCDKERYLIEFRTNWQTTYKYEMTVRQFMFTLATDAIRDKLHMDTWVNALMVDYDSIERWKINDKPSERDKYPNWIITDWRFENEGKAIELRDGIKIRVERDLKYRYPKEYDDYLTHTHYIRREILKDDFKQFIELYYPKLYNHLTHQSETELDNYVGTDYFKYTIYNNGDVDNLITQCYDILLKEQLV